MIKKVTVVFAAVLMAFIMTACTQKDQQQLVYYKTKFVVPDVPNELYYCPTVKDLPASNTLTDAQIAQLLVTLDKYNKQCKYSLTAVKAYLEKTRVEVAKANK